MAYDEELAKSYRDNEVLMSEIKRLRWKLECAQREPVVYFGDPPLCVGVAGWRIMAKDGGLSWERSGVATIAGKSEQE